MFLGDGVDIYIIIAYFEGVLMMGARYASSFVLSSANGLQYALHLFFFATPP